MKWVRCPKCRTVNDVDRYAMCDGCNADLPSVARPDRPPQPPEMEGHPPPSRGSLSLPAKVLGALAASFLAFEVLRTLGGAPQRTSLEFTAIIAAAVLAGVIGLRFVAGVGRDYLDLRSRGVPEVRRQLARDHRVITIVVVILLGLLLWGFYLSDDKGRNTVFHLGTLGVAIWMIWRRSSLKVVLWSLLATALFGVGIFILLKVVCSRMLG